MIEYTCAICNEEFESDFDNLEVKQECIDSFGVDPSEDNCVIVCDDCYNKCYIDGNYGGNMFNLRLRTTFAIIAVIVILVLVYSIR